MRSIAALVVLLLVACEPAAAATRARRGPRENASTRLEVAAHAKRARFVCAFEDVGSLACPPMPHPAISPWLGDLPSCDNFADHIGPHGCR